MIDQPYCMVIYTYSIKVLLLLYGLNAHVAFEISCAYSLNFHVTIER